MRRHDVIHIVSIVALYVAIFWAGWEFGTALKNAVGSDWATVIIMPIYAGTLIWGIRKR
jgi:hypothetical protein